MDTPFAYTPKSAWDNADAAARKDMDALAARYVDFLSRCKTERETVAYVCERLKAQGYAATGDKVVRPLRGKAVFAARRGALPLEKGLNLVAAHADSPRLDFKQRPLVEQPAWPRLKLTTTAASANTSGWRALWPCTGWSCARTARFCP